MTEKSKRRQIHINRYEKKILIAIFVLPLLLCALFTVLVNQFYNDIINMIAQDSTGAATNYLSQSLPVIVLAIWAFFLFSYIAVRMFTHNMLGAFDRVLKDLDEMNASKVKRHLQCRKHDTLTGELVQRLNAFIDTFSNK